MKTHFHKIGALGLAALLLFSTLSFTVDFHFCGKHLVDFAINDKADGCWMELPAIDASEAEIAVSDDCLPSPMSCCQDVQITVNGQEELQHSDMQELPPQHFVVASFYQYTVPSILPGYSVEISYKDYVPPLISRDLPILNQSFLI